MITLRHASEIPKASGLRGGQEMLVWGRGGVREPISLHHCGSTSAFSGFPSHMPPSFRELGQTSLEARHLQKHLSRNSPSLSLAKHFSAVDAPGTFGWRRGDSIPTPPPKSRFTYLTQRWAAPNKPRDPGGRGEAHRLGDSGCRLGPRAPSLHTRINTVTAKRSDSKCASLQNTSSQTFSSLRLARHWLASISMLPSAHAPRLGGTQDSDRLASHKRAIVPGPIPVMNSPSDFIAHQ